MEIVGDRADGIWDAVLEVDATVAIEVDGVVPDAAGQKLWQTDRPGERTVVIVGCAALLLRHQKQVFEFAAKQTARGG